MWVYPFSTLLLLDKCVDNLTYITEELSEAIILECYAQNELNDRAISTLSDFFKNAKISEEEKVEMSYKLSTPIGQHDINTSKHKDLKLELQEKASIRIKKQKEESQRKLDEQKEEYQQKLDKSEQSDKNKNYIIYISISIFIIILISITIVPQLYKYIIYGILLVIYWFFKKNKHDKTIIKTPISEHHFVPKEK